MLFGINKKIIVLCLRKNVFLQALRFEFEPAVAVSEALVLLAHNLCLALLPMRVFLVEPCFLW